MTQPPPMHSLLDANGRPILGLFEQTPARVNWRDADYRSPLGRRHGRLRRRLAYKQFEYFGIVAPDLFAGCALADLGWVGAAFMYVYVPSTGAMESISIRRPLGRGLHLTHQPVTGHSHLHCRRATAHLRYSAAGRALQVETRSGLEIDASFAEGPDHCQPMSLCTQTARNGWVYARKIAGTRVYGQVTGAGVTRDLGEIGAFAHHDYSAGFMRRETFWNWACFSAQVGDRRLGLNVSCGVNETGFSENCLWLDGARIAIGPTHFDFRRDDLTAPWTVRSACGALDLEFVPCGRHTERLNAGLIASDFRQDFGFFSGRLQPPGHDAIEITQCVDVHADVPVGVVRFSRHACQRLVIRGVINHAFTPDLQGEISQFHHLSVFLIQQGDIGDVIEVVAQINPVFNKAVVVTRNHDHREG